MRPRQPEINSVPRASLTRLVAFLLFGALLLTGAAHGQAIVKVVSFGVQGDGAYCGAGLTRGADGNLYGVTGIQNFQAASPENNPGAIISISPQGVETVIHPFNGNESIPQGAMIPGVDGNMYGVVEDGGANFNGAIFRFTPGSNAAGSYSLFASLGPVNGISASNPAGPLLQDASGNLYGIVPFAYNFNQSTESFTSYQGAIFVVSPQGTETFLHLFADGTVPHDGETPNGGIIHASDGNFYGTTQYGGSNGSGVIYKITPAGQLTILHNFNDGSVTDDGSNPTTGLIQSSDGNFYGTTNFGGGGNGNGTIYKMTPAGQVTILHSFLDGTTLNDGTGPAAVPLQGIDGNFYGTTQGGGTGSQGIVWEMTPQGVYSILHNFNDGTVANDGQAPMAPLIQGQDGTLYGTTSAGGQADLGTAFALVLDFPALTSFQTIAGTVSVPFSYRVTGTNGASNFSAVGLPNGLTIDATTGIVSGTPTTVASTAATVTLTNGLGSSTAQVNFNIAALTAPIIGGFANAYGTVNVPFSYTIAATNFPGSYSAAPLPAGLTLNATTGVISGTPQAVGVTNVSVTARNTAGTSATTVVQIAITSGTPNLSPAYAIVHRFNDGSITNDGEFPNTIFQAFDGSLYGTTQAGGTGTAGTVFNVTAFGTTSSLLSFGAENTSITVEPSRFSQGLLQGCDGNFYGTAQDVGTSKGGYIYSVSPSGVGSVLHYFGDGTVPNDGTSPNSGLIQGADGNFYGTTEFGGKAGFGCIYQMTPRGAITILHSFDDGTVAHDGQYPTCGLTQGPDGNFYGMTFGGGSATANAGTIFQLIVAPSTPPVFNIIHQFGDGMVTNDGAQPGAALFTGDDGNLYGTTAAGGSFTEGCVFQVTTAGAVTILHSFGDGTVANDGETPMGPLIEGYDTNFYGTTSLGGSAGEGTVFSITKAGTETIIHHFGDGSTANDGSFPIGLTQTVSGNFYGVTETGGFGNGFGTVFAILAGQTPIQPPIFTGATFEAGHVGQPFVFFPKALFGSSISASGSGDGSAVVKPLVIRPQGIGTGVTFWTESGTLPNLLQFNSTSGEIDHDPIVQGTFPVSITPHNNIGSGATKDLTFYFDVPPVVSSPSSASASVGVPFTYPVTVQTNYPFPSIYGMTQFPGWLSINPNTGVVSGTPPASGTFTFTVTAANIFTPVGMPSTQVITLVVGGGVAGGPSISSATAVPGTAGTYLSYQILASNSPTNYGALQLPPGLTCDSVHGIISGTPTTEGLFQVPISVTNSVTMAGAEVTFTIAPSAGPTIPTRTITALVNAYLSFKIPTTGLVSLYDAYNQGDPNQVQLPPGLSVDVNSGYISGTPTSSGTYNIVVSAVNNYGSASSVLTLIVGSPIDFGTWETQHSFSGAPTAITNGDGVPNELKFAFDVNPSGAMTANDRAGLPVVTYDTTTTPGKTYLAITYRKFALLSGYQINLQSSPDLSNWTTVTTPSIDQQVGNDPNTGDPMIEMGIDVTTTPKAYVRLNVTGTP